MLSKEQVRHIAALARLGVGDELCEKYVGQLNNILDYVEVLSEVNTKDVESTSQVTGLENVTREDRVARFCDREELLDCSPLPKERDQIRVKPVITN